MYTVLKRGWRARPGWVLALSVVLALNYVCIVCMAAAASAAEVRTEAVAGTAIVAGAEAPAQTEDGGSATADEADMADADMADADRADRADGAGGTDGADGAEAADGAGGTGGSDEDAASGAGALAPDAAHDDCDATIMNTAAFFGSDTDHDSGVKSPVDYRIASTALLLMLLLSVALAVVLWLPRAPHGAPRAVVYRAAWRPSGIRLLTTLCIQRV